MALIGPNVRNSEQSSNGVALNIGTMSPPAFYLAVFMHKANPNKLETYLPRMQNMDRD